MGFLLPAMSPEKLETQRQVVMNERRQRVDNQPYGRAFERLHELLYPSGHPYHWPVIGYMEDIAAATLEDVRDFFRTYYVPANAVLTLVGDFQPAPALEQVERFFGPLPGGRRAAAPDGRVGPLAAGVRETLPDDVQLARVYLGFRVPPFGEPGWYAADLLATALTSGKSSLLYHDLVYRRELAQDVSAFVFPTELAATFGVVATARPGVAPAELERALLDRLEESAARPLPDIHLERARNQTQTTYFEQLEVLDQRADLLSLFTTFFDDPGRIEEEPARYLSLDRSDLQRCAAGFLRPEQRATVTVVPRRASP
jgi:predicted Zn-dependent peptidase